VDGNTEELATTIAKLTGATFTASVIGSGAVDHPLFRVAVRATECGV
jgi:hypothetical protein